MAQPLSDAPRDLLLDENSDLVVTTDLQFSRGVTAVAQSCRIAMQLVQDEWFLDLDIGIPYWDSILGQKPTVAIAAARIFISRELRLVDGVLDITKLFVTYDGANRAMRVQWQVRTALGDTPEDTIALSIGGS